jgi:hypothetical protein
MSEEKKRKKKVYVLKRSDVKKSDILVPLWVWTCPLCVKQVVAHTLEKALAAAKLHLERVHHAEVEVAEA